MRIINFIKEKKREFEDRKHLQRADRLKEMKQERVRLEGQAKLKKLEDQEIAKIKSAKKEVFKGNHPIVSSIAGSIQQSIEKKRKEAKKQAKKGQKSTNPFGGQSSNNPWK